jgi:hypothetical protein
MSTISDIAEQLRAALATVDGLRAYIEGTGQPTPPAAVVGLPTLTWAGIGSDPTRASWPITIVTGLDNRAAEQLWSFVPLAADALDTVRDAVVSTATPVAMAVGGADLPAYQLIVETEL